ncbi:Hypothetical predicted protein [Cloeon dipterum]|uniref:LRRCT domain-containing protein n=1 Tax=Cloeon dipterum TaxID=197152 RepID=A0A8S1D3L8_9INSE|nr:Hypothetical predicted protein [Cloeon dipterum]
MLSRHQRQESGALLCSLIVCVSAQQLITAGTHLSVIERRRRSTSFSFQAIRKLAMRCQPALVLILLTFGLGCQAQDDEFDVPDDDCPVHCVCSQNTDLEVSVRCEGLQDSNGHKHLVADLTGQMQAMVTSLEVYNSSIHTLRESFLVGTRNFSLLRNLRLSFCEIEKIDLKAFKTAYSLEEVDLSNNILKGVLHAETFNLHCPNLMLLKLKNNPKLELPVNKPFLKSQTLQEIDLSDCGVTHVYQQSFAKLQRLTYLNLENNAIEYVHPDAFARLPHLEELNLAFNRIVNVPQTLPLSLQILSLRGNRVLNVSSLTELNPEVGISDLDISQCDLDLLPVDLFYYLPELINLNISHNHLTTLNAPFVLRQLQYLDVSYNALEGTLDKNLFTHTSRLETLRVSHNQGLELPEYGFLGDLTSLFFLDLSGCGLRQIRTASIDTLTGLAHLNVSHNALTTIPAHIFRSLSHLSIVDLSFNSLKLIPPTLFEDNAKLRHLILSHNADLDGVLQNDLLANNAGLKLLDISYCSFDDLPESLPQSLTNLNIAGNRIEQPNQLLKLVQALPELGSLQVGQVEWKCSFSVTFLRNALQTKGVFGERGVSWSDWHDGICPDDSAHQQMASFPIFTTDRNLMGTHFWSIVTFFLTLSMCVVIAVGSTVAYRGCKNRVRAKAASRKYHTLSESPSASPAPHRIYKETTVPITKADVQPVTFSRSFIFPRFPVTQSDLPVSYVEGKFHHDELVP